MKLYVKSSFGYRDSDWIDPPEDDYENEGGEIIIDFDNVPCEVIDDGNEVELTDYKFEDYYDPEYDNLVAEGSDLEEMFYDLIDWDTVPQESGKYLFNGTLSVIYDEWVPIRRPTFRRGVYDEREPYSELDYKSERLSDVSFKRA